MIKLTSIQIRCFLAVSPLAMLYLIFSCTNGADLEETVSIGRDSYKVKWLFNEPFDDQWQKNWIVEGDSLSVYAEARKLYVDDYKGATIWNMNEFPKNLLIRFKVKGKARLNNRTNFNLITHARSIDGDSLSIGSESGRKGQYKLYHIFPNYLVTFVDRWTRTRKNPGFNLLNDVAKGSVIDSVYKISFTVSEGRLRYYVNGEKVHDIQDDAPLGGGKVGIRTWNTRAYWYDVEIGEIID